MTDGKHCPACGVDIGVWPIFAAGLPNLIRCPRCKARLRYAQAGLVWLVATLAMAAVLVAAFGAAVAIGGAARALIFAGITLAAWVPIELLIARHLRAHKALEDRSGKPPPSGEGAA
jgi:hypothetical protein